MSAIATHFEMLMDEAEQARIGVTPDVTEHMRVMRLLSAYDELKAEVKELRVMLYAASTGMRGYHDDGELQDNREQPSSARTTSAISALSASPTPLRKKVPSGAADSPGKRNSHSKSTLTPMTPISVTSIPGTPAVPAVHPSTKPEGRAILSVSDALTARRYYVVADAEKALASERVLYRPVGPSLNSLVEAVLSSNLDNTSKLVTISSFAGEESNGFFASNGTSIALVERTVHVPGTPAIPAGEPRIRIELSQEQYLRLRTVFNFTPVVEAIGAREWAHELRADNTYIHLVSGAARYACARGYAPFVNKLVASIRQ